MTLLPKDTLNSKLVPESEMVSFMKRYEVYEKQYVTIDEKNITQVFLSKQCYHINSCLLKVFKKT